MWQASCPYGHMYSPYCANPQELALNLHAFFKGSGARKEDLQSMQQTLHVEQYVFLWYVPTRWVTLAKVLQRIIQQMPVIVEMRKEFAKLDSKNQPQSAAYRRIASKLQKK